jgi:hypothetical protein
MIIASRLAPSRRWPLLVLPALIMLLAGGCTATASHPAASAPKSAAPPPKIATAPVSAPSPSLRIARPSETKPFVSPIQPDNRPTAVAGDGNGLMPRRDLLWVAPHCLAARAAAPSLGLLLATAREEGVIIHTEQCYRPLSDEVAVRQNWSVAGNSACAAPVLTTASGAPVGTSMHGWGKAADFRGAHGTLTFGSRGYRFLTAQAGRFGWNHPDWARPGGSSCPEAWHWEWVGDGGTLHDSPIRANVVTLLPTIDGLGYSIVTGLGTVRPHGDAPYRGSPTGPRSAWLVVSASRTPNGGGYWLAGAGGSVRAFGDARYFGSIGGDPPSQPIVGIAPSTDGAGYWLAASDGQVFGFGAAGSYASPAASGASLRRPIVAIAATPDGRGYWLAGADGKVFASGDAVPYGGASGRSLRAPVVSITGTLDGRGYWLVGADGSVYPFGDAPYFGSIPRRIALREPVVAIASTPDGEGYWLVAADGAVFALGDAQLYGPAHDVPMQGG